MLKLSQQLFIHLYNTYRIAKRIQQSSQQGDLTKTMQHIGIVSLTVSLAIILIALVILYGFQHTIQKNIYRIHGHFQAVPYTLDRSLDDTTPIPYHKIQHLSTTFSEHIASIQANIHKTVLLKTPEGMEGVLLKGITSANTIHSFLICGDTINTMNDILIDNQLALKCQLKVGDKVQMYAMQEGMRCRRLVIKGIYHTSMENINNNMVFCQFALLKNINKWTDSLAGSYAIFLKNHQNYNKLADSIENVLDYDVALLQTKNTYAILFDWLTLLQRNITIFIFLLLLITGMTITTIVTIQLMQGANMVGILLTLGATNRQIVSIFFWNSIPMLIIGFLLGNLIGLGLCWLQDFFKIITLDADLYYVSFLPIHWCWSKIALVNTVLLIFIAGLLWIIMYLLMKFSPLKTINFKR